MFQAAWGKKRKLHLLNTQYFLTIWMVDVKDTFKSVSDQWENGSFNEIYKLNKYM